ncbi:hypothetical protein MH122_17645 [Bacillus pumilus]|uniref:Uncharacterized protein n=1 Tax=Bacillus zhangzhouensis TaxID=1178540 RepID=A0A081LDC3_9BACI|nr:MULTISPECIES: hypothetical protein [Bacillus]KEP27249.1 hypothetical protein BA70_16365 [Bacillus zhangzhouensis]MCY7680622.1 hypothetical protein [Bacillus pumilus]
MSGLPIDFDVVNKNAYLPVKLSELSKVDPSSALEILNQWGEGTKPITVLWETTIEKILQNKDQPTKK